jgi:uncharacterized membrane protein HdeD (DUF308 family)
VRVLKYKENQPMIAELTRNWWVFLIRGIAAVLFGIAAFVWPGLTIAVLVLMFGAYALIDGIFAIIAGIFARNEIGRWWMMILVGLAGIAVGVLTFMRPGITALVLLYYIAAWAIISGIFQVISAIQLRREIEGEWFLVLGGIASVLFGLILFLRPGEGALASIWIIGSYAIIFGILMMVLAFRLRGWRNSILQQPVR